MRDTRGPAARRLAENLWVPAGLARARAATVVAALSTLALLAVLYVDIPLTAAVTPAASAPDRTAPFTASALNAPGSCLTAARTVPTGAGASSGCAGASAAGAEFPHRAGSAESLPTCPLEPSPGSGSNFGPPAKVTAAEVMNAAAEPIVVMAGHRQGSNERDRSLLTGWVWATQR